MTGRQIVVALLLGIGSLFCGGALSKTDWKLGPLFGCILLLYGTVGLVGLFERLAEKDENSNAANELECTNRKCDDSKHTWLLLITIIGLPVIIGWLESVREKVGFSIFGVIFVGCIFAFVNWLCKKK